jgi:hypothetical protein
MKPTALELTLDLAVTGSENRDVARVLRLAADQIEERGLCPGGVWGGEIPPGVTRAERAGYWIVRAEEGGVCWTDLLRGVLAEYDATTTHIGTDPLRIADARRAVGDL